LAGCLEVSPALNQVNLGFHLVRARWTWAFTWLGQGEAGLSPGQGKSGQRAAVLAVPAWL